MKIINILSIKKMEITYSLNKSLLKKLFIFILIIFIKFNIFIEKKYQLYNSISLSLCKKKNKIFHRRLAIALPVDSEIFKKKLIYNSLKSIFCLNYNYTLYIIYNKKCPKIKEKKNIVLIKNKFNCLSIALNQVLDSISYNDYDYITFLTPGDLLTPSAYDFLNYIEEHDIYQIFDLNTKFENKFIKYQYYTNSKMIIYDLINKIPNNNYAIYDKIYKISLLKKKKIKFIEHEKSLFYFNLLTFSFAKDLLYIDSYGIKHNIQSPSIEFFTNKKQENNLFRRIISANKMVTKKIIMDMEKIDYVFPFVTTNDSHWKKLFSINLSGKENDFSAGILRFRDNGLLKFLFRSLEKYLPWINKVHMIVMSDSQVPTWVNKEKVHIIYHSDFIPKQYLPTFSSSLIECFLPFLPLVAEKFIYGNDDLIPCRYLKKKKFFYGDIPCYNINLRDYTNTRPGDSFRRNAYNIITRKKQEKRVVTTQHSTISYKMSLLKNCFKKYKKEILKSLSKFREEKNVNQYVYSFYQMVEDTILNRYQKIKFITVRNNNIKYILNKDFKKIDFICLNDNSQVSSKNWAKIISKFEKLLPEKSKYEK